ncbi:hypothetical protein ACOSQ2_027783 [Xanthoceras sorbifolium]
MAPHNNPHRCLLLFGRDISLQSQEQQGCSSTSMAEEAKQEEEEKKRNRPENDDDHDHDQHSDVSSSEVQQSNPTQQQQIQNQVNVNRNNRIRLAAWRIGRFRHYSLWEEEEERRRGVSTRLELYSDPWRIKKRLTTSDVGHLSRVLVQTNQVDIHVKPFMERAGLFDQVEKSGLRVSVRDVETDSVHRLVFKRWIKSSRSFIFIGNWCPEFVHRRRLKEGDEIGFLWDPYSSTFLFRVLSRSPNPNPNPT